MMLLGCEGIVRERGESVDVGSKKERIEVRVGVGKEGTFGVEAERHHERHNFF